MKFAAVQLNSTPDVETNLAKVSELLNHVDLSEVKLIGLPECFAAMTQSESDKLAISSKPVVERIVSSLAHIAKKHGSYINAGTIYVKSDNLAKYYARSLLINPAGEVVCHYDKIHLFDVELTGNENYRESNYTLGGNQVVSAQCDGFKLGFSVCYDLRFPELYQQLMQQQVDVICVPSAFTYQTGAAHWQTLLCARAIETQCYVVAANQVGVHANGRRTYGHSMIIDPWGKVIAQADEQEAVLIADFNPQLVKEVRQQIPLRKHKRPI